MSAARVGRRVPDFGFGVVLLLLCVSVVFAAEPENETPWPYSIASGSTHITVFQPQVSSWDGSTLTASAAVSVTSEGDSGASFGIIEVSARTLVDKAQRLVTLDRYRIVKADFPSASGKADAWVALIRQDAKGRTRTLALDRLEAARDILAAQKAGGTVALRNDPPAILFSSVPAMLVYVDGQPAYRALPDSKFQRVINTRPLVVRDVDGTHYLHVFDGWMTAPALTGPWAVAKSRPDALAKIQKWAVDSKQVDLLTGQSDPDQPAPTLAKGPVPLIRVAFGPTELIVTQGAPKWVPIPGTQLLFVENTTGNVFKQVSDQKTYVLTSGRWFRAAQETGPWEFVSADALPRDFADIPDTSPKENVKASVAHTPQAREAAIAATIPETAAVKRSQAKMTAPVFDGEPHVAAIPTTPLHYVENSATPIIEVDAHSWYAVENGVWFSATSMRGPWVVATAVPVIIYSIPASSPLHYVTYVRTYAVIDDTVYVGYTPGYHGECVDAVTSVVVYGTGYYYTPWIGTVWYGPPVTYGFGVAMRYTPWTGWTVGFGFGWAWGVATVATAWGWGAYPWWGPYAWGGAVVGPRGAVAWGPGGWAATTGTVYSHWGSVARVSRTSGGYDAWTGNAWSRQAGMSYNSRTGTLAAGQRGAVQNVYTGNYASGARGVAANPNTGIVAAGRGGTIGNANTGREITAGQASIYNRNTGNTTDIAGIHGDRGTVVDVNGDLYAGHDGHVYRRGDDGWQRHDSDGWQPIDRSQPQARDLDRERTARSEGAQRYGGRQNAMGNMRSMGRTRGR
ncbi:MAG: autotransporter [Gammaproteobacteria bacterium]